MSLISKYLKQTCEFEQAQRNIDGTTILDTYGDVQYQQPVTIKCRREKFVKDVETITGAILRSNTRYFTDENYSVLADDRIDGKSVMKVEEYVNPQGKIVGYESYV